MISYETLDTIADSYIPILLALFVAGLLLRIYQSRSNFRMVITHSSFLFGLLVISYGIMFFDNAVYIWPSAGLDYSTHTAVALSLVFALCVLFPRQWISVAVSMVAYAVLMWYQQYHSVLDIISTSMVIGGAAFVLYQFMLNSA